MTSAKSSSGINEQRQFHSVRTQDRKNLDALLYRIREALYVMPQRTPCLQCGTVTTNLVRGLLQHEDFQCTIPLSVCFACSKKPPFVLTATDERMWWTALLAGVGVAFGIGQQWLLSGIAMAAAGVLHQVMRPPIRITRSERNGRISELLSKAPEVQSLLAFFPDCETTASHENAALSRELAVPLGILDESLRFHEQITILCDADELSRSGVNLSILKLMVDCVNDSLKKVLRHPQLPSGMAFQVDVAVLPGRRTEFEIQICPQDVPRFRQQLATALQALPHVPVNSPFVFSIRRCDLRGCDHLEDLPSPFPTWQDQVARTPVLSYVDVAIQKFQIETTESQTSLTVADCAAWRSYQPENQDLALLHVELLRAESRTPEAIEVLSELTAKHPGDANVSFRYALIHEENGQQERAAAICQQIISEHPEFTEAFALMAHLQLSLSRPQDAAATLAVAPKEHRSVQFWQTAAEVAVGLNQDSIAMGYINTAILKDSAYPNSYLTRAQMFAKQKKYSQALDDIVRYQALVGPTFKSTQIKAGLLKQLGHIDQAIASITEALQTFPNHPLYLWVRADYLADASKLELAKADCDVILDSNPQFAPVLELRARIHVENDDADAAIQDADRALQFEYRTSTALCIRGLAKFMKDDPEGACDDLTEACVIDPNNVDARFHLSRVHANQGQLSDAIAELTTVLELAPEWPNPRLTRGFLSLTVDQLDAAANDFDEVMRLAPHFVDAYRGRSLVHEKKNQHAEAMAMLDKALLLDPDDAACRLGRSRLLQADNDLQAARADLDSVLSSAPDLLPALLSRAHLRLRLGQFDEAAKDFDAILRDHPEFTPALIGRSIVWDQQGDWNRSEQDRDAAAQALPESAEAMEVFRLILKSSIAQQNDRYDDAIQAATDATELSPDNETAYQIRAGAYWYSEQFVEALQDYGHLIESLESRSAGAYSGRGQVYAEMGEFELALPDMQRAVELARDSDRGCLPYSLSGLGKSLTGLGRLEEADAAFRESLSLEPENAWLQFNRGLFFMAKHEPQHARMCFELALRLTKPALSPRKKAKAQGFVDRMKTD